MVRVNVVRVLPSGRPVDETPHGAVAVTSHGQVDPADEGYARAAIDEVLAQRRLRDGARVRLTSGARVGGPAVVQVNLRVHGAPARVQVAGGSRREAIELAAGRLSRQLRRLTTAYEPWPWPDPQRRPLGVPLAGVVRRHKTYRLHVGSPCQAVAFMNAMDYDVMLFTDADTGEDAVVYRSGPTGLRLARQWTMRPPALPVLPPITVNAHRVPTVNPAAAAELLVEGGLPHLFFTNRDTGRGGLIYRRFDGDLGLIAGS